ncbi:MULTISPECIES: proteasome assembly chaperone family protein [unclassified Modestobacter]|uniref:proteasome assembly chaperone family protein n=1 Tax=unclassified Modestobacter TaxID=2643866 RepID=UPI0022AB27F7|nr:MULTISPECIES: PAC2 family protein [unclassified Modestobacter]MCZ2814050.1 PAC2 family protein [Modestobacter sp. VKM Ac-2979]MCZ2844534.1 PAC2 family protein [Modestobacter sp. VKM Ac-2980]MCZ2848924.1 PAC2 family protein [Modestobacter sp. VKM Ac-2978]
MPQRPEDLVEVLPEAEPFLAREAAVATPEERRGLVLVHHLAGDFDAAHAGALTGAHLLDALPNRLIARFDVDALVDYRGHRPRMTFSGDRYVSIASPEIGLYALEDDAGTPFLLLHGAEPDYAWERFVAAVLQLVDRLGVTSAVALHAIPMPVPHTRPVTVTAHATRRQLIESYPLYWGEMRIPGSVGALLELRLGEAGVDALGIAAHVPHYLTQATYPAASLTLLEHLTQLTGLLVPTETLREAAEAHRTEVDEQIARSSENTAVVSALEEQFDSFAASREETGLLGFGGEMPSGDELGAQIERFLAEQDGDRPTD